MHHTKVNTTEIRIVHEYVDNDKDTANVNHLLITCVKREVGVSPLFFYVVMAIDVYVKNDRELFTQSWGNPNLTQLNKKEILHDRPLIYPKSALNTTSYISIRS